MESIVYALTLLSPFDIDRPKARVGPAGDGGYVFVDDFEPEQNVVSYGIGTEFQLDLEFARRGHHVYMFDHTIAGIDVQHPRMHFISEGVAGQFDQDRRLYSIADHLERHEIGGERLIVKIDVEGIELEALAATPDEVFARFEQLVIEVHDLHLLEQERYRGQFVEVFEKINRHLTLFHLHANNCDGPDRFFFTGGVAVPQIIELSYVRSSRVERRPSKTLYPTALDFPNTAQREKLLWTFPFLPSGIDRGEFIVAARRLANAPAAFGQVFEPATGGDLLKELELKEAELQRLSDACVMLREQLELKEAELQRIFAAGVQWREQLDVKEAELRRVTAMLAHLGNGAEPTLALVSEGNGSRNDLFAPVTQAEGH